jgi:hypothetical protein
MPVPAETPKPKKDESSEEEQPVETETTEESASSEDEPEQAASADGDFKNLTPREKALVQKARAQEKQKLYEDIKGLKKRLKTFEDEQKTKDREEQTRPKAAKSQTENESDDDLRQMIRELRTEINDKERRNDIRNYRRDKIAEVRAGGERIIEALVMGESEEDIDASVEVAKAEAAYIYSEAERELRRNNGGSDGKGRTVVMRETPRRPGGVPPTVSSGSGSGDTEGTTMSMRDLLKLASMDSVRDGTYAANRKKIHEALIEGRIRQ